ncbi:MAG TPA: methyltransferase domain-containing protein [Gaiellaceae bacterium]|nr:methyltransferase domain-containing protein [Gaiellaceae bacterium]
MELRQNLGRRFARLTTNAVVAYPTMWRVFRPLMRRQFDSIAPRWDAMRTPDAFAVLEPSLTALPAPPSRVLDLGTGTGKAAFAIARRFPEADVVGIDLAPEMIREAQRLTPPELAERVRFQVGDASSLPFGDESFDLVSLANMIPFFDELARVVRAEGHVLLTFSGGAATPIYVPFDRLRDKLGARGFTDFAAFEAAEGTALLARKRARS